MEILCILTDQAQKICDSYNGLRERSLFIVSPPLAFLSRGAKKFRRVLGGAEKKSGRHLGGGRKFFFFSLFSSISNHYLFNGVKHVYLIILVVI